METEKVMDKLRDEMAAKHGDPGIQIIGEAMTRMLRLSPDTAEAVGAEGKTLAGAFAAVRSWAEKHKTGNSCFVPPAQAVEIVCGYYGIQPFDLLARAVRELMMEQNGETAEEPQALAEAAAPEKRGGETATVRGRAAAALDLDAELDALLGDL